MIGCCCDRSIHIDGEGGLLSLAVARFELPILFTTQPDFSAARYPAGIGGVSLSSMIAALNSSQMVIVTGPGADCLRI